MTTVRFHLVASEQVVPNVVHQVVSADNQVSHCPVTLVPFEWGGLRFLKGSCESGHACGLLLGNDLHRLKEGGAQVTLGDVGVA